MKAQILISLAILAAMSTTTVTVANAQAELRPFWGSAKGEVSFVLSDACPPQPVQTLTTSRGQVTHLGSATLTTSHCASSDGTQALNGRATFTAANGDQVFATYTGHTVAASQELIVQEGEFAITGGTGRFAQASGRAPFTVYINPVSPPTLDAKWPIRFSFAGSISY
jgi:hypothetical protein